MSAPPIPTPASEILYRPYIDEETDLGHIVRLVESELSEPYTIYTYRYFLLQWPSISFLAYPVDSPSTPVGVIVCKQDPHRRKERGYIAMLSIDRRWRKRGIASKLVQIAIKQMTVDGADEIVLETEEDNAASLSLYASLGFLREKRLYRFYLNGKDAYRLLLPLPPPIPAATTVNSSATPNPVALDSLNQMNHLDHPSHISAASSSHSTPSYSSTPSSSAAPPTLPLRQTMHPAVSSAAPALSDEGEVGEGASGHHRGGSSQADEEWMKAGRMMESFTGVAI